MMMMMMMMIYFYCPHYEERSQGAVVSK